jgi:hypothetical protein
MIETTPPDAFARQESFNTASATLSRRNATGNAERQHFHSSYIVKANQRCSPTLELTGREQETFYQIEGFNDERNAVERSGSMSC